MSPTPAQEADKASDDLNTKKKAPVYLYQVTTYLLTSVYKESTKFIWRQENSKGVVWCNIPSISSPEKIELMCE